MVKVSICIPAYNQVKYLRQTIDSVLNQTFTDYEIIITDDSPTDIVFDLVKEYQSKAKIQYYKNAIPLGSPENWNEAIRLSKGEYIKIMHHDDYFTFEHSLQAFVDLMENSPNALLGFSSSVVKLINKDKIWIHKPTSENLLNLKLNPYTLFFGNFIGAPSATIFRRSSSVFFDVNLKWVVDFEFYCRLLAGNSKFEFDSRELITTVGDDHNITNDCRDNRNVEIKEYLYLYNSIPYKNIQLKKTFYFFRTRFYKFSIFSIKDIKMCGYVNRIPKLIYVVLIANKGIKVIKKLPAGLKIKMRSLIHFFFGRKNNNEKLNQNILIGKNCTINQSKFGKYNKVNDNSFLYKVGYGDYTYSAMNVTIMNCNIGKFCSIAQGVCIGLGKHPVGDFVSTHPSFYSTNKQCGTSFSDAQYFEEMGFVTIGNDVWIGANVVILDDVNIGNGAVIAANSVVTKDVFPYSIVGGIPAKLIKYRFSEEDILFLEKLEWWNKDDKWLQENFKAMHNIIALKKLFK